VVLDASSRIRSANPPARELLGAFVVGTRITQYLPEEEAISFELYRRQVLASSDRFAGEFTLVDAKGRRREIRLDGMRTTAEGTEWRAALIDMSVQNAAVRKLNHAERLEAVGQHASGIAHDLNNLLYSIAGYTEIALRFCTEGTPGHDPLVQLRAVLQHCTAATQQLTSFTRSDLDSPSIVNLNLVIEGMEIVLRSLLGDDVTLHFDLAAADPSVRMAEVQLEQILLSAVRNARHAMPSGGEFRVETDMVVMSATSQDGGQASARYVRWTMSDTGSGMSEDSRRRAFEPFFTTKPPGSGTGLGLSLVKAIVERAGGSALLESELGVGTSLVIHLPCASASTSLSSRPPPPPEE
jgi:signal transduction histidine kinase